MLEEEVPLDVCAWCGDMLSAVEQREPEEPCPGPDYGLLCSSCRGCEIA